MNWRDIKRRAVELDCEEEVIELVSAWLDDVEDATADYEANRGEEPDAWLVAELPTTPGVLRVLGELARVEYDRDEGGEPVSFGAGDLVVFPEGLKCIWDIKSPVRKHYKFG